MMLLSPLHVTFLHIMTVIEITGYLGALLMGLSLGLIGGGGSILTVPILVYLFAIHPVLATAYCWINRSYWLIQPFTNG